MTRPSTIAARIEQLIEQSANHPLCDDCITDLLYLSVRTQANVVTRKLGLLDRFERGKAECSECGVGKTVIQPRRT